MRRIGLTLLTCLACIGTTPPPNPPPNPTKLSHLAELCNAEPMTPPGWMPGTYYLQGQRVASSGGTYQVVNAEGGVGQIPPVGTANFTDGELQWAPSTTGTVRYACDCGPGADSRCSPGNDAADGSEITPWRTLDQARKGFNALHAGDTVALCRGGSFIQENDESWGNAACRAENNCTLRDYYAPWDSNRSADLPTVTSPAGHDRGIPFMSGGAGYRVMNLKLVTPAGNTWGFGLGATVRGLTLCNVTIQGFGIGVQDDCGNRSPTTSNIVVMGSRFINNTGMGALLGGNGDALIDNTFDGNASEATFGHSVYISNHAAAPIKVKVIGNRITKNVINAEGKCSAVSIVVHGQHDGLTITDNVIDHNENAGGGCWGVQVSPGGSLTYLHGEFFRNVTVRGNKIFGTGSVGIGVDICTDCLIENNLVVVSGNGSSGVEGIKAPTMPWSENGVPVVSGRITVRNNTVYFAPGAAVGTFLGLSSVDDGGPGPTFTNNAVTWAGLGSFRCMSLAKVSRVANNACFGGEVGYAGATGTVFAAPKYTAPGSTLDADFRLQADSPLIDAGAHDEAPRFDIAGKVRDIRPDIGAYER